jgi:transposase
MSTSSVYIGIDVAKATLEVASCERVLVQVPNTDAGHRQVVEVVRALSVALVVIESTGVYGQGVVRALVVAGLPVAVVQPGRVRYFARSKNILAKTDAIDATVLADFAQAVKPRQFELPSPQLVRLRAYSDRRDQVVEDRVREQNRLEACTDSDIAQLIASNIAALTTNEETLTREIASIIAGDATLKAKNDILQNETGIGPLTASILLAQLPELGSVNRQEAGALAGLVPYDRSSGAYDGSRHIYGGRARVREALYMAAITACRWNPHITDFYQRLLKRGKAKKLAIIACARKLLVRLNALLAKDRLNTRDTLAKS